MAWLYVDYIMHMQRCSDSTSIAFKKSQDISQYLSFCSPDVAIITVTVVSARELSPCASPIGEQRTLRGLADPIVQLSVENMHPDNPVGEQLQRTSVVLTTLNPSWKPPERFQFILQDASTENILLNVISQAGTQCTQLGSAVLTSVNISEDTQTIAVPLVTVDSEESGEIVVSTSRMSLEAAKIRACYDCL
mmetsp:Transcript_3660/g.5668  ORF Transcript_3660/g.5668 Transcript_3660/m.5668 type:complete len:192 (+) Transcript_3660:257-832(+)|eukprot:CAMPEP_0185018552 /NCGR_PEP_ID=MMETSP1103-20130426/1237_1 /TAXON_ID=36769 /ORGANISM="Paraphysomonas bandaiensis, Strain Caron Lab Isolate" /LENGTH=191 /DNA_ID=CAMNT_0027548395 /DNA_START=186 /DNA_END=761 /DNA_ORIENTATION=-